MTTPHASFSPSARLPEVEAQLAQQPEGDPVPVGATEQHGPHAPFGTDYDPRDRGERAPREAHRRARRTGRSPTASPATTAATRASRSSPRADDERRSSRTSSVLARGRRLSRDHVSSTATTRTASRLQAAVMEIGDELPEGRDRLPASTTGTRSRPSSSPRPTSAPRWLHANIGETSAVMAVDESLVDLDARRRGSTRRSRPRRRRDDLRVLLLRARATLPRAAARASGATRRFDRGAWPAATSSRSKRPASRFVDERRGDCSRAFPEREA